MPNSGFNRSGRQLPARETEQQENLVTCTFKPETPQHPIEVSVFSISIALPKENK